MDEVTFDFISPPSYPLQPLAGDFGFSYCRKVVAIKQNKPGISFTIVSA